MRKRDEASKHVGDAQRHIADARGNHGQGERTTPPLSTHHIDIADIMKQAEQHAPSADRIPYRADKASNPHAPAKTTSPRHSTRGAGREGETRQSDKEGKAMGKQAKRGRITDRGRGHVSRGQGGHRRH